MSDILITVIGVVAICLGVAALLRPFPDSRLRSLMWVLAGMILLFGGMLIAIAPWLTADSAN